MAHTNCVRAANTAVKGRRVEKKSDREREGEGEREVGREGGRTDSNAGSSLLTPSMGSMHNGQTDSRSRQTQ